MVITNILLFLTALSAIPALVATVRRYHKAKTTLNGVLLWGFSTITIVEWVILCLWSPPSSLPYTFDGIMSETDLELFVCGSICGDFLFINIAVLLLSLYAKRHRMGRFFVWLLILFVAVLFAIAVVGSIVTGRSLDECFFGACCGSLYAVGLGLGLSYKEICVVVNIYLEAALCLLSGLWVTWACIKCYCSSKTLGNTIVMLIGMAYGLGFVIGFVWICCHYAMPMNNAFDLCYRELIALSKEHHTTYNIVNYVIFILFFLICTLGNMVLARQVGRLKKSFYLCSHEANNT